MIRTLNAFLDFCYLVRKDTIDTHALEELDDALSRFQEHRTIFVTTGIRSEQNLVPPRQHSADHYLLMIREFGAPNGLCTSITESKHIKAVKEPWRRSNRFKPLQQMLVNNERMDKLTAARAHFEAKGMLDSETALDLGTFFFRFYACFSKWITGEDMANDDENIANNTQPEDNAESDGTISAETDDEPVEEDNELDDNGDQLGSDGDESDTDTEASELADLTTPGSRITLSTKVNRSCTSPTPRPLCCAELMNITGSGVFVPDLVRQIKLPRFVELLSQYMSYHSDIPYVNFAHPLPNSWHENVPLSTYPSVKIRRRALSSGGSEERSELVRATETWRKGPGRFDTVFVQERPGTQTISSGGLSVARVRLFFLFFFAGKFHQCAFVTNYQLDTSQDPDTGMWIARRGRHPQSRVIPLTQILRAAHLIPVYGTKRVPKGHSASETLDKYATFYVNKYIDYDSFELAA